MGKLKRKLRRLSLYKKTLFAFISIVSVLCIVFLVYVYKSMVIYERNLVDNYIEYLANSGKLSEDINNDLFEISKYEKKNAKITDGVKKTFKNKDLKINKNSKLSKDNIYAYDLSLNDTLLATVSLKSDKEYTRMAILKINEWNVTDITTYFEDGVYSYEITIPKDYTLTINGKSVSEDDLVNETDVNGLDRLTKYIEISKNKTYKINNLVYEPDIKITNEKEVIDYEVNNNKIIVNEEFKEIESLDEAKEYIKDNFNILELAENWSLFLTDDLGGSYHGLHKLTPYLITDSYMYNMAYEWSHGIDITFVSNHSLKNPTFTNEKVENFIIYNDLAFSCEVYLEKNMMVSGKEKVDIMHDKLYFIYYDGNYKLVDMQSIEAS